MKHEEDRQFLRLHPGQKGGKKYTYRLVWQLFCYTNPKNSVSAWSPWSPSFFRQPQIWVNRERITPRTTCPFGQEKIEWAAEEATYRQQTKRKNYASQKGCAH
eukprot:759181-Pelagomonas_calceolata.AAC.5